MFFRAVASWARQIAWPDAFRSHAQERPELAEAAGAPAGDINASNHRPGEPSIAPAPAAARPTRPAAAAIGLPGLPDHPPQRRGVSFEPNKIAVAMTKAFLAVHGTQGAASASVREMVDGLTETVVRALLRSRPGGGTFHIEDMQDQVELGLMRAGQHEVARAYVLYREQRAQERAKQGPAARSSPSRR